MLQIKQWLPKTWIFTKKMQGFSYVLLFVYSIHTKVFLYADDWTYQVCHLPQVIVCGSLVLLIIHAGLLHGYPRVLQRATDVENSRKNRPLPKNWSVSAKIFALKNLKQLYLTGEEMGFHWVPILLPDYNSFSQVHFFIFIFERFVLHFSF